MGASLGHRDLQGTTSPWARQAAARPMRPPCPLASFCGHSREPHPGWHYGICPALPCRLVAPEPALLGLPLCPPGRPSLQNSPDEPHAGVLGGVNVDLGTVTPQQTQALPGHPWLTLRSLQPVQCVTRQVRPRAQGPGPGWHRLGSWQGGLRASWGPDLGLGCRPVTSHSPGSRDRAVPISSKP